MKRAKLIGIGGVSRSGKSTLALRIRKELKVKTLIISQDEFIRPINSIPKIKDRIDWEHPTSIDFDKILETIRSEKQNYELMIVEGLFAFQNDDLLRQYDYTILLETSHETFIERRKKETRWGIEPDWYLEHVWKCHLENGTLENPNIVINKSSDSFDLLIDQLKTLIDEDR